MRKKILLFTFVNLILASFHLAEGQQPAKIPKIGFLSPGGFPGNEWRLLGSWWTNAWLRDRTEWRNTFNAPVPSVTATWESWSPNGRPRCPCRRSMDGA
jgi:hypothetical protein